MNVAIIFHMPGVFDSGWAGKILECLEGHHKVSPVTYGTMGRTAVLDSCMENKVSVKEGKPSDFLKEVSEKVDAIVLAMYALSPKKSHAHCWHLINSSKINKPVVEVEARSGVVIPWTANSEQLAFFISRKLGFEVKDPPKFDKTVWIHEGKRYRRILAVDVGDYILVNKITVGKAVSEEVILVEENGILKQIVGANLKREGLNKLNKKGKIDLEKISVETTSSLRFTEKNPRIIDVADKSGVVLVNHAGYDVYRLAFKSEAAVTIGDDTTSIVGDILYRFKTPILGIIDGDGDSLLQNVHISKNSTIVTVKNDDEAGEKIYEKIFNKKLKISKKKKKKKNEALNLIKGDILEVKEIK